MASGSGFSTSMAFSTTGSAVRIVNQTVGIDNVVLSCTVRFSSEEARDLYVAGAISIGLKVQSGKELAMARFRFPEGAPGGFEALCHPTREQLPQLLSSLEAAGVGASGRDMKPDYADVPRGCLADLKRSVVKVQAEAAASAAAGR